MGLMVYDKLDVYRIAFDTAIALHKETHSFPKNELYGGLTDQMRRSSKSICANVAEGLSKNMSLADKKRFLQIATGSAEETRVWLSFAGELGYLTLEQAEQYRDTYARISQMLYKLQSTLKF
jgi:four helix bundle protein